MSGTPGGNSSTAPSQYAAPAAPTPEELARLPHDSQGPKLVAVAWTMASVAGLFLILRLYCKYFKRKGLWWDDYLLIGAWISMVVETALLTVMRDLGYGLHIWDFNLMNMGPLLKVINVAGTFSVIAVTWSKTSFAITLLRVTDGWTKRFVWFIIVSINIAMGLTALFPWVQCSPVSKTWDLLVEGTCWSPDVLVNYNIFSASYSATMDVVLALLPWKIVWNLQMKKKEKFGVGIAMSLGIFAGVTAIVKTTMIPKMRSADFADGVDLFLWGNAESAITIVAASIPVLRVFVREAKSTGRYFSHDKGSNSNSNGSSSTDYHLAQGGSKAARTGSGFSGAALHGGGGGGNVGNVGLATSTDDEFGEKGELGHQISLGRIVRTKDFSVEYHQYRSTDSQV